MKVRLYEVIPYDAFAFGDLSNFQAGEESWRRTLEIPDVSRFFHLVDAKKTKICGVFISDKEKILLPVPGDVVAPRKGEEGCLSVSILKSKPDKAITDIKSDYFPETEGKVESAQGFISFNIFKNYIKGCENLGITDNLIKSSDIFVKEFKVGLSLNQDTFTAEEGRLYMTTYVRLKNNYSYLILTWGDEYIEEGDYHIGGETRVAKIKEFNDQKFKEFLEEKVKVNENKLYRLYLTSSTYVSGELKIGTKIVVDNLEFELVWAFISGKEWISGYRKPAILMLKPGSVLILKANKNGNLTRLTFIEEKAYLPVYKDKDKAEILNEEKEPSFFGWNYGIFEKYEYKGV